MKRINLLVFALAFTLLSVSGAWAQGKYRNVELTILNKDGRYQKNEKVEVWAERLQNDGENLLLTVLENGEEIIKAEPLKLKNGKKKRILSKSYDQPVNVLIKVAPESNPKEYSSVAFIVAPEEFRPGFEEPADFQEYWQAQVAQMRQSEMVATLTPVEIPADKKRFEERVEVYDLEISMPEGNPVRAYISWPKNVQKGSCGILIVPHGAGVRTSNLNNAIHRAHSNQAIVIDINAHGILNGQSKEFYKSLADGELKDYRTRKCAVKEDCYFRLMYLRMQRVLDYACSLDLWDGKKVVLDGTSQGGGQSAALAGLDPRVTFVSLVVPALTDMGGKFAGHNAGWPYFGRFDEKKHGDYMNVVPYYDAVNFLKHYNGILVVEAGLTDTTCPPECVFAAFNVAASTDKTIYTNPYRSHGTKELWENNLAEWEETIGKPRKEKIMNYLRNK